ncbi:hypothetical protein GCM10010309_80730 [Streptomyces violaceochromogenes]|nr:hypothetical protein GCM10010309_80730 [Streptomyces violaceochromogenes]
MLPITDGKATFCLDGAREAWLVAEAAVDRVRDKYRPNIIGPEAALCCADHGGRRVVIARGRAACKDTYARQL